MTIRVGEVAHEDLTEEEARRLPRYPVPVLHLARLAVDRSAQGQRLGEKLLVFALQKARDVAEELSDDRLDLYLSMKTVRRPLNRG